MHALEPGPAGEVWTDLPKSMPRPRAILVVSAHWETDQPALTGSPQPETIHDFSGFPEPLYRVRYPAPGAPDVAARALALLQAFGFPASVDKERGLDHGVWSPLLHMFPQADIPVVELSVQPRLGAVHHLEVGRALAPLTDEGVLILGSGHMTHNLREWIRGVSDGGYVYPFRQWVRERLIAGDHDGLAQYRTEAPHATRAHPTEEHFLPLFVALGAAGTDTRSKRVYDGVDGVLAMDAYLFSPARERCNLMNIGDFR
jgi:4,5-DOPA dioxygenase extradiol